MAQLAFSFIFIPLNPQTVECLRLLNRPPFSPPRTGLCTTAQCLGCWGRVCHLLSTVASCAYQKATRPRPCVCPTLAAKLAASSLSVQPVVVSLFFPLKQFFFLRALPRVAARTNVVRDRSPRWEAIVKFQTDTTGRHRTPRLLSALCLVFPSCRFRLFQ